MDPALNKQFNRLETEETHVYINDRGGHFGDKKTKGRIKCTLLHGRGFSVIAPDQLYVHGPDGWRWIQPLAYMACLVSNLGDHQEGHVRVDISCRETVEAIFSSKEFLRRFDDGSELYDCTFRGPKNLLEHATGTATFSPDLVPRLRLYHFTTEETKQKILQSEHYRPSAWNIQGNKKLENVGYAYFTCLDKIATEEDLRQIAMASDAVIYLITDKTTPPPVISPAWVAKHKDDFLELTVYRESTTNRTARLDVSVEAPSLAPQHVHRHSPPSGAVYYNSSHPFIYRVGLPPVGVLKFVGSWIPAEQNIKRFSYAVLGDATTLEGLAAPYDEENTTQRFLVENTTSSSCMLEFWFANANRDLVSGRRVEKQAFQK